MQEDCKFIYDDIEFTIYYFIKDLQKFIFNVIDIAEKYLKKYEELDQEFVKDIYEIFKNLFISDIYFSIINLIDNYVDLQGVDNE
jgi:hypothetical protein